MIIIDIKHNKKITVDSIADVHVGDQLVIQRTDDAKPIIDGEVRKVKHTIYVSPTNVPNYYRPYDYSNARLEVTVY